MSTKNATEWSPPDTCRMRAHDLQFLGDYGGVSQIDSFYWTRCGGRSRVRTDMNNRSQAGGYGKARVRAYFARTLPPTRGYYGGEYGGQDGGQTAHTMDGRGDERNM